MALRLLNEMAVGSIVKIRVNGTNSDFIIINQGKPSNIYDDSCDGTWLLMKDIYENRQWHSSNVADYANSAIHSYLNSMFLSLFAANIQSAIMQVKIPYRPGSEASSNVSTGANGLSTKIFLLSGCEMNWASTINSSFPDDGATVGYFAETVDADTKRIGYLNGTAAEWWLRSPITHASGVWYVGEEGSHCYGSRGCTYLYGVRPALVLSSALLVSDDGAVWENTAPTITCDLSGDIGEHNEGFTISYTVNDLNDGDDSVTVTESLDGEIKRTYTATLGEANTFEASGEYYLCIPNGEHTITITATDTRGASDTLELTFTKAVRALSITLATPKTSQEIVAKTLLGVIKSIPLDAEYAVTMTNNANDTTPVWEDATAELNEGKPHAFANQTAANGPAYNFMITASRGESDAGGWVSGIRGAFKYAEQGPELNPEQVINYTMFYDQGDECGEVWRPSSANTGAVTVEKRRNYIQLQTNQAPGAVLCGHTKNPKKGTRLIGVFEITASAIPNDLQILFGLSNSSAPEGPGDFMRSGTVNGAAVNSTQVISVDAHGAPYAGRPALYSDNTNTIKMKHVCYVHPDDPARLFAAAGITKEYTDPETFVADPYAWAAVLGNSQATKIMTLTCTGDLMYAILNSADCITAIKSGNSTYRTIMANPHWSKFARIIPAAKELLGYTMLYDQGDECETVTGGWGDKTVIDGAWSKGTVTKGPEKIRLHTPTSTMLAECGTINKIDFTNYEKLCAMVELTKGTSGLASGSTYGRLNLRNGYTGTAARGEYAAEAVISGEYCLDISTKELTSNYYVSLALTSYPYPSTAEFKTVFLLKSNPFQPWLAAAGITKSFASLDEVLSDEATLAILMSNREAIQYMLSCTGTLMAEVCQSETASSALVNSPVAYDAAFENVHWRKFMLMCPVSLAAMDSVAKKVPLMTSNTAPEGECFASSSYSSDDPAWGAFDGRVFDRGPGISRWGASKTDTTAPYVGYDFGTLVSVYRAYASKVDANTFIKSGRVQGSNDREKWIDAGRFSNNTEDEITVFMNTVSPYRYWRIICDERIYTATTSAGYVYVDELRFYGKEVL